MIKFSWVDLFMIGIFLRGISVGRRTDFVTEIFRLLGVFLATIVALHYYMTFSNTLIRITFNYPILKLFSFCILAIWVYSFFSLLRKGWKFILQLEGHPNFNKITGMILSLVRRVLLCGLFLAGLMASEEPYLIDSSVNSFSGVYFKKVSPAIYRFAYDTMIGKLMPGEPVNLEIFRILAEQPPAQTKALEAPKK
ncbi:MAG: CvpA family protein [Candidatus Omnitrophica bacterium]|nr:CvpA family protein [Candidatus Omnitrophota bacterium]